MINRESKKRILNLGLLAVSMLAVVLVGSALAQGEPNDPVPYDPNDLFLFDPNMEEEPRLPGTVEGTGTYFEVTDSNYLNITFESSESVHLRLESVPEMIVIDINSAEGAASTQITLTGFEPSTTYYKYEDDYHNEVAFTTDDNGSYTFAQDLSQPHLVFIQPNAGTWFLAPSAGQIPTIGSWNESTRTFTLTEDVYETIQIDEDNLTLDGAGHTLTGPGWWLGFGIYLSNRTGVIIKNVNVQQFNSGIYLWHTHNSSIENTVVLNTWKGILLQYSNDNILTANTTSNSFDFGIDLYSSSNNILVGNNVSLAEGGMFIAFSHNNTLIDNIASNNPGDVGGIELARSNYNTLTGNICNSNQYAGISLDYSTGNILTGNTTSSNGSGIHLGSSSYNTLTGNHVSNNGLGIYLRALLHGNSSSNNKIYNNNFIDNVTQTYTWLSGDNIFNLDKPIGGNYWSDWTSPDADSDGFVDEPYVFTGGQDNLPWTRPFATPVQIDIKPGSYPNAINLGSYGLVPIAILSSDVFDATTVDPDTVELAGAVVEVRGKSNKFLAHAEDVNGDGLVDLVVQVATANLEPESLQDGFAALNGTTYAGNAIEGEDEITIVPPE